MPSEFDLITRYFVRPTPNAVLGPGDDCAVLAPAPGMELAITTDMLVSGTHFLPDADPCQLGWKTLAVNLSDLAAMGAKPRWALLAGSLPSADEPWLAAFADGLFACAERYGVDLVGGDTTRGPLNLCVTALGEVPAGAALRRDGAQEMCIRDRDNSFSVDVSPETLSCTIGLDAPGPVNLEKALRLSDRLGGHLVSGHVDGVGEVLRFDPVGDNRLLEIRAPEALAKYIAVSYTHLDVYKRQPVAACA